jgi:hypothetical protein
MVKSKTKLKHHAIKKKSPKMEIKFYKCVQCIHNKVRSIFKCQDCESYKCVYHSFIQKCSYCPKFICGVCINFCDNNCRKNWNGQILSQTRTCDKHTFVCGGCHGIFCVECLGDLYKLSEDQKNVSDNWCLLCTNKIK